MRNKQRLGYCFIGHKKVLKFEKSAKSDFYNSSLNSDLFSYTVSKKELYLGVIITSEENNSDVLKIYDSILE